MGTAYLPLAPGETTVMDDSGNVTVFDTNGNAVTTYNNTDNWDTTPTTPDTPVDASGGTDISNLSRFTGYLGGLATAIASAVGLAQGKSAAPICPSTLPCAAPNKPGYNFDPKTGQYIPSSPTTGLSSLTAGNGLFVLAAIAVIIFFVAKR
jgi:hypothetical protein